MVEAEGWLEKDRGIRRGEGRARGKAVCPKDRDLGSQVGGKREFEELLSGKANLASCFQLRRAFRDCGHCSLISSEFFLRASSYELTSRIAKLKDNYCLAFDRMVIKLIWKSLAGDTDKISIFRMFRIV